MGAAVLHSWGRSFCTIHRAGYFCDGTTRVRCCQQRWGFVKCGSTAFSKRCGYRGGATTAGGSTSTGTSSAATTGGSSSATTTGGSSSTSSSAVTTGGSSFCRAHGTGDFCYRRFGAAREVVLNLGS